MHEHLFRLAVSGRVSTSGAMIGVVLDGYEVADRLAGGITQLQFLTGLEELTDRLAYRQPFHL
ncbi:MAG TPA: hypothetical protein VML55_12050 [Planctomycetaceae bacterium]|nr:hypothetical protein [Planctomycetaceae bacterium]